MNTMKTPGVYIEEKSAFPNSVVEVATAVPAFIGHTEKAINGDKSLENKPWRITSMAEFHTYFGGVPKPRFSISELIDDVNPDIELGTKKYQLKQENEKYILYYSLSLFFANGGGPCYIVSVGNYNANLDADKMIGGVQQLIKEQEPSMLVIPETTLLDADNSQKVHQEMLSHCGSKMRNRFAILDIWEGFRDRKDPVGDRILDFRDKIGINFLDFGAAYYPWINTAVVSDRDITYENIANKDLLQSELKDELLGGGANADAAKKTEIEKALAQITDDSISDSDGVALNSLLIQESSIFKKIIERIKAIVNLLPPSAAIAGIYTMVDNTRGVWKAPANVSLNSVVSPAVDITPEDQEDLNVPLNGKAINAIRPFIGEGTLVWGARTLDGNSLDWRYINVKRTMIMLEESIKIASKAYVFEPNVANTWVTMKGMISSFLTGIWKQGGLAGASPDDAYSVCLGLGETMTPEDILEGILRVTVMVAVTRPAEFIEITFQQQMQKS